ncbi:hypothetical protein GCK72_007009 [Caenorhabditis remanei]|uniref:Uncharacterized protein n=1 Tax=Caenorhabditis remanei TaxID=31234 RepID=A0A6A5HIU3_CAERE|nr:hypothetical protein GCK72_007009 [Caenorhabditis remanei]KAF1767051.1 hypothetical protein GCK72_007009 [Caenorhabditis remanei]
MVHPKSWYGFDANDLVVSNVVDVIAVDNTQNNQQMQTVQDQMQTNNLKNQIAGLEMTIALNNEALACQNRVFASMKSKIEELTKRADHSDIEKTFWKDCWSDEKRKAEDLQAKLDAIVKKEELNKRIGIYANTTPSAPNTSTIPRLEERSQPVKYFASAIGRWLVWTGKDEKIEGIDLNDYLFHPDKEKTVPQVVRKAPNLRQMFGIYYNTAHQGSDVSAETAYKNLSKDDMDEWYRKANILKIWQDDQIKQGMVKIVELEKKRKAVKKEDGNNEPKEKKMKKKIKKEIK